LYTVDGRWSGIQARNSGRMVLTRERLRIHLLLHGSLQILISCGFPRPFKRLLHNNNNMTFIAVSSKAAFSYREFTSSGTFRHHCGVHDSSYETHFICVHVVHQLIFAYKYNLNLQGKVL